MITVYFTGAQLGGGFCLSGYLAMSGNILGDVTLGEREGGRDTGIWRAEARDAVEHPIILRGVSIIRLIQPQMSIVLRLSNPVISVQNLCH